MKILVVDDKPENTYLLQKLLTVNGFEVVAAANGEEALAMARKNPPGIIITDILMPGMDGFTLCKEWKSDEVLKKRPFIFYTATYTDQSDQQLATKLGADRFIVKPMEPEVFVQALRDVIEQWEEGKLSNTRAPTHKDEKNLLQEYNTALVRKLEDKMLQLAETRQKLDHQVKEQETRIRQRTDELQRMVNAMAGREVRMAELKKIIQQLRSQLLESGLTPVSNDAMDTSMKEETANR